MRALLPLLLAATLLSALASFLYEVGWIRMLSLVLGSATHAFELWIASQFPSIHWRLRASRTSGVMLAPARALASRRLISAPSGSPQQ